MVLEVAERGPAGDAVAGCIDSDHFRDGYHHFIRRWIGSWQKETLAVHISSPCYVGRYKTAIR